MSIMPSRRAPVTGATVVAGVAGSPVRHSLSPLIQNAWLDAAGIDGVYVPFAPPTDGFDAFVSGLRGGTVRGVNVTIPFKEQALACATSATSRARAAAAANLLIFEPDGSIVADNTDGLGLLGAFAAQAPGFHVNTAPVAVLGAGGAARGAAAALLAAGCPEVRIVNRTLSKAEAIAEALSGPILAFALPDARQAFAGVGAVINATSAEMNGGEGLGAPLEATPDACVVMDMVYKPLVTPFLHWARTLGRPTVDGLAMLIGQAAPSYEAFYGQPPPAGVHVRALALKAIEP
jgi:shikimate dehydrogenase